LVSKRTLLLNPIKMKLRHDKEAEQETIFKFVEKNKISFQFCPMGFAVEIFLSVIISVLVIETSGHNQNTSFLFSYLSKNLSKQECCVSQTL
jgi:hypothetical protein